MRSFDLLTDGKRDLGRCVALALATVSVVTTAWQVSLGTGAYVGMTGGGRPSSTATADLALGTVAVSHRGKARLR
jgi:hypothetical protein